MVEPRRSDRVFALRVLQVPQEAFAQRCGVERQFFDGGVDFDRTHDAL
jgi:hypothetical protein